MGEISRIARLLEYQIWSSTVTVTDDPTKTTYLDNRIAAFVVNALNDWLTYERDKVVVPWSTVMRSWKLAAQELETHGVELPDNLLKSHTALAEKGEAGSFFYDTVTKRIGFDGGSGVVERPAI